jgi:hypothetical protein
MAAVDWATFGINVIGGASGALLMVGVLGKTLIKHMLDKEQCKFQANLEIQRVEFEAKLKRQAALELERVRGVIDIGRVRHEVMLARLQDQRLRVIGRLYAKLAVARVATYTYVMDSTTELHSERVDKLADSAYTALQRALSYFSRVHVWLPKKTAAESARTLRGDVGIFANFVSRLYLARESVGVIERLQAAPLNPDEKTLYLGITLLVGLLPRP